MNLVILIAAALIVILATFIVLFPIKTYKKEKIEQGKCSSSCGALDPVNEPDYNVREAIKQTLLLEQHLAEKSKYCKSCITKHFLIIEASLMEGVWMACNRCADYPKLEESVDFFKNLFKEWHANMDDDKIRLDTLTKLREWRREMVDLYYFNGEKPDV